MDFELVLRRPIETARITKHLSCYGVDRDLGRSGPILSSVRISAMVSKSERSCNVHLSAC